MRNFIGYGKSIVYRGPRNRYSSQLVIARESNEKYIFRCIFTLINFMAKTNGKVQDKTF